MTERLALPDVATRAAAVLAEVERAVLDKHGVLELVLACLLADGHVLLEDLPGLAKTLIARSFAEVIGLDFGRVQFTPDLMPADITGSSVFDPATASFAFHPGPVFSNLLLGDEINRAPPKSQAALLEAMQERQVTVDGTTRPLDRPFLVIATQNPIEYEGTYPLPEAQLDRFTFCLSVGYPSAAAEARVLAGRIERRTPDVALHQVVGRDEFLAMQDAIEDVHVAPDIVDYVVAVTTATRTWAGVEVGASPRGSLAVLLTARARALLRGRDFVVPDDVKAVARPALGHRLRLRPDLWVRGERGDDIVAACLAAVPTPVTDGRP
ncbi:MAG TPA: MoxR family ATPase [Acidimicrobiales bacterium]